MQRHARAATRCTKVGGSLPITHACIPIFGPSTRPVCTVVSPESLWPDVTAAVRSLCGPVLARERPAHLKAATRRLQACGLWLDPDRLIRASSRGPATSFYGPPSFLGYE